MRLLTFKNISKFLLNGPNSIQIRCHSSNYLQGPIGGISHLETVVTTEDNSMFVAWHPTTEFPYEYSKPIPPQAIATSTLLKDEAIKSSMEAFGKKHPAQALKELMRITYTSKHVWRRPKAKIRKLALARRNLYKEPNKEPNN